MNLDDLNTVHQLDQLDQLLQQQIHKLYIIKHSNWFITTLSISCGIIFVSILYNLSKWIGLMNMTKRLCCYTQEPRNLTEKCLISCLSCIHIYNQSRSVSELSQQFEISARRALSALEPLYDIP